jgi:hypothetical protein
MNEIIAMKSAKEKPISHFRGGAGELSSSCKNGGSAIVAGFRKNRLNNKML